MPQESIFVRDLRKQIQPGDRGITSQTLHNDERAKLILFRFLPGQELKTHKAPVPVTLTFLQGEAVVGIGSEEQDAAEGSLVYMTPLLNHSIRAKTEVTMLLTMMKDYASTLQA